MGLATPSEAAAMGSLGSILLALVYRSFTWAKLTESVYLTARTSAMVCWLFVGSAIFSSVFGYLGGQELVEQFFKSLPLNTLTFMLLAQALIFVLGWPLEWTEIIVIFVPIFLPLLDDFGVDPLFFGVLVALNLQTSFLVAARRDGRLLPQGRGAEACPARGHLQGLHALHLHRHLHHGLRLRLPGHRHLAAVVPVRRAADRRVGRGSCSTPALRRLPGG